MAINKNHECEELDGLKCAIVERNVSEQRAHFLKELLEFNKYEVLITAVASTKVAAPANTQDSVDGSVTEATPVPQLFTVGVTDLRFNSINAIFGRLLKTPENRIVTLAYWRQDEPSPRDAVPYFASDWEP